MPSEPARGSLQITRLIIIIVPAPPIIVVVFYGEKQWLNESLKLKISKKRRFSFCISRFIRVWAQHNNRHCLTFMRENLLSFTVVLLLLSTDCDWIKRVNEANLFIPSCCVFVIKNNHTQASNNNIITGGNSDWLSPQRSKALRLVAVKSEEKTHNSPGICDDDYDVRLAIFFRSHSINGRSTKPPWMKLCENWKAQTLGEMRLETAWDRVQEFAWLMFKHHLLLCLEPKKRRNKWSHKDHEIRNSLISSVIAYSYIPPRWWWFSHFTAIKHQHWPAVLREIREENSARNWKRTGGIKTEWSWCFAISLHVCKHEKNEFYGCKKSETSFFSSVITTRAIYSSSDDFGRKTFIFIEYLSFSFTFSRSLEPSQCQWADSTTPICNRRSLSLSRLNCNKPTAKHLNHLSLAKPWLRADELFVEKFPLIFPLSTMKN